MQHTPRRIEAADCARIYTALAAGAHDLTGARLAAIVTLAHGAALDLSELLAIRLRRTLDLDSPRRWTLRRPCLLPMARGRAAFMPEAARATVEAWIRAAAAERITHWPPPPRALLFSDAAGAALSPRTVQHQFTKLQEAANTARRYRFSDLRHDAISRYARAARSPSLTAQYARISERSALVYLPPRARASIVDLAEHARAWTDLLDPVLD